MPFWKKEETSVITIENAIAQGLISFKLTGAGGGNTSKVYLEIKNLSDSPLRVEIPSGTRFSQITGGE